jgi:hypothetical protein
MVMDGDAQRPGPEATVSNDVAPPIMRWPRSRRRSKKAGKVDKRIATGKIAREAGGK